MRTSIWSIPVVVVVLCCARPASADQVIADDLIVQGSACVGFDCVNGESFGFDTVRLKENNIRIKFEDTSTSASFPSNDWQLTANETSNGGANKFSIDDTTNSKTPFTVEGNSPTNSLYVDNGGRIGLGTSNPVVELHVVDGDTPTLRLEQDGSSGFTPQTWDVAGNETNFFVRDTTGGSDLCLRIRVGAPANSIFVNTNGDVGLGTASPDAALHVIGRALVDETDTGSAPLGNFEVSGTTSATVFITDQDAGTDQKTFQLLSNDGTFMIATRLDNGGNPGGSGIIWQAVKNTGGDTTQQTFHTGASADERMSITDAGINVTGTISQNAAVIHPDYVFEPDFKLETIDDHAAYMWKKKHLPAVGAGEYDEEGRAVIDLGRKTLGILEELEKAHIYIEQLHKQRQGDQQEVQKLTARIERLEAALAAE